MDLAHDRGTFWDIYQQALDDDNIDLAAEMWFDQLPFSYVSESIKKIKKEYDILKELREKEKGEKPKGRLPCFPSLGTTFYIVYQDINLSDYMNALPENVKSHIVESEEFKEYKQIIRDVVAGEKEILNKPHLVQYAIGELGRMGDFLGSTAAMLYLDRHP